MAVLQCDMGNSALKWRLLEQGSVLARGRLRYGDERAREALLASTERLDSAWVASVADPARDHEIAALITGRWGISAQFPRAEARTADLVNSYREPWRMGVDRWLAMLGARSQCRERLCVVDAGSALTIDLVAADGRHEGGFILPGLELMERALLRDTGRVRFDGERRLSTTPGCDTQQAVQHGSLLALSAALERALGDAALNGPEPRLFLCGGGAESLAVGLRRAPVLAPDLVFDGLTVMADCAGSSG